MARTSQTKATAAAAAASTATKRRRGSHTTTPQQKKQKQKQKQEEEEEEVKGESEEEGVEAKTDSAEHADSQPQQNGAAAAAGPKAAAEKEDEQAERDQAARENGDAEPGDEKKGKEEEETQKGKNKTKKTNATTNTKKRTTAAAATANEDQSEEHEQQPQPPPSKKPKKNRDQHSATTGTRQSSRITNASGTRGKPTKEQLLRYLVSPDAEHLCRPDDEAEALASSSPSSFSSSGNPSKQQQQDIKKTYGGPTPLTPFEELISAMILSRPISHRLGLRTIRTVLNPPYGFASARAVRDAGEEKRRQALWDARTQHKDKTAAQLGGAAEVVLEKYCGGGAGGDAKTAGEGKGKGGGRRSSAGAKGAGSSGGGGGGDGDADGETLAGLVAQSEQDIDEVLDTLQKDIKGFGKTTGAIFRRRIQWLWDFAYPFVDERTADGLKELGLPIRAEALVELLGEHWDNVKGADLAGDDEETRKRRAFTIILERATNARLEGKVGDVLHAAAQV
ncbi:uncharacterized protein B0I36DRAFT_383428 [Microdochium trichocladiopsis]|uniref:Uncharacterized protein n=1 Tax=Microdochium trichocladiopsis TaxID=1682393 RepID=A0A9P8Y9K1_9PEZI|nr:uncharacterized protein B0I36DRAFT_383428 [Microdochium trichocladiopsis]KAH7033602.1 hypothetical protein B0I36DRAFT_383428 [Microdochium trichocladiopsis]